MFRKVFWKALLITTLVASLVTGIASAETRNVSNVTGTTWHDADVYRGRTTSTFLAPWIYVNIRAWGGGEHPLKDQMTSSQYNAYDSGTAHVADIYGPTVSRHVANTPYGGIEFYTSGTGCESNFCWWYYDLEGSCPSSC